MGQVTLTARELRAYRQQLLQLDDRLAKRVSRLEAEALRPSPAPPAGVQEESPAHEADPAVQKAEDEVTMTVLGSEEHVLNETRAALARIDAGTYGKCERCGHAIARVRLDALPYARHCVRCARDAEGPAVESA
jgi:RNA polymerase-binding transcription factor DksA